MKSPGNLLVLLALLPFTACHSNRIEATVTNHTGAPINLLEVDYPSASFGSDTLAPNADFHYGFQVRENGPLKVQYTESTTRVVRQASGPTLYEKQQGHVEIDLLPRGTVEFHTELSPRP
ncbi:MAG TPA: hypothetical protein VK716_07970 [Terracidiphilus sp.]|jgi:hypothetical protein|nr:hypothetical protein [Terracidiphilus sp.]